MKFEKNIVYKMKNRALFFLEVLFVSLGYMASSEIELSGQSEINYRSEEILTCLYTIDSVRNVKNLTWSHNGNVVALVDDITFGTPDSRAIDKRYTITTTVRGDNKQAISRLRIKGQCSFEGVYECFGANILKLGNKTVAVHRKTLSVKVIVEPAIPTVSPQTATVAENSSLNIRCSARVGNNPRGTLSMYLQQEDGQRARIPSSLKRSAECDGQDEINGTVTLMRSDDKSRVQCLLKHNRQITAETRPFNVQYFPDSSTLKVNAVEFTSNMTINMTEGRRYTVTCQTKANPLPSFAWYKMAGNSVARLTTRTKTLTFLKAAMSNQGTYWCVATSTIGGTSVSSTSNTLTVQITKEPITTSTESSKTSKTTTKTGGVSDGPPDNTLAIALGVAIPLAVILIVVIIIILCKRRSAKPKYATDSKQHPKNTTEPDLYKNHKQPSKNGSQNTGYQNQEDYLSAIPMSREGRSRNPIMESEDPYHYSMMRGGGISSQYSHSRPV